MAPKVSAIIPTYNSERTIAQCINSLTAQTYNNLEVIVVDNFSTDETAELVQRCGVTPIKFKGSRTEARNFGARKATGSYLLHIDSDMKLSPHVVEACVALCESGNADAIIIPEVAIGRGYWAECLSLQKNLVMGARGREAARFMRRDLFESVGGYNINLEAGEDFDLHFRLLMAGAAIGRTHTIIEHDVGQITLKELRSKFVHYGRTVQRFREANASALRENPSFLEFLAERLHVLIGDPIHATGYLFISVLSYIIQK